ncbi:MAG: hypothetical protein CSA79_05910, partial [Thiothrix nivea]
MSLQHTLKPFEQKLQTVREKVASMAVMTGRELADSLQVLKDRNQEEAADIAAKDALINASERVIDELVIQTIVMYQPMA